MQMQMQPINYAKDLQQKGIIIMPCLTEPMRKEERQKMINAMKTSPEFRPGAMDNLIPTFHSTTAKLQPKSQNGNVHIKLQLQPKMAQSYPQLGGFGGTAGFAALHSEVARDQREQMFATVLISGALPPICNYEYLTDRWLFRGQGQTPTAESFHRDESPMAKDGDVIYGGWLNLDETNNFFHCVPGTHDETGNGKSGFAKLSADEIAKYKPLMQRIAVPPGHIVFFNQRIVHEVASIKSKELMVRHHIGVRATHETEPLFGADQTYEWLETQGVMKLKSGQAPRLWPTCYSNYPKMFGKLEDWSTSTFRPECIEEVEIKSGSLKGKKRKQVMTNLPSLEELKLPKYDNYQAEQIEIYSPRADNFFLKSFHHDDRKHIVANKANNNFIMAE
jgi:hypothetical protein